MGGHVKRRTEQVVGLGEARVDGDRPAELRDRFIKLPVVGLEPAQLLVTGELTGFERDRLAK